MIGERLKGAFVGAAMVASAWGALPDAVATPIYSLQSVNACDTCHIEPSGWKQPDLKDRRCTLDCNACHVSPVGGAMRTPAGRYYARETLAMYGLSATKGEDFASKYRPEGHPTAGRYRLGKGFEGWWPGDKDSTQLDDRYGNIEADPMFFGGADVRWMIYAPLGDDVSVFPMQVDLYGMARPLSNLVVYANGGMLGYRTNDLSGDGKKVFTATIRELFVKADRLPYNSYVLGGRFNVPYGSRIPDHTSFIRRSLGLDQNSQAFGVMAGANPNYPYVHVAAFGRGVDGWPGDNGDNGYGVAATAGVRELGWTAGGSAMAWRRVSGYDDVTLGPKWGVNLWPVAYIGELDFQRSTDPGVSYERLFAYHEVDWRILDPLATKVKWEWVDPDLELKDDHRNRASLGVEWHPYTFTQIELIFRRTWDGGGVALSGSEFTGNEVLMMFHGYM